MAKTVKGAVRTYDGGKYQLRVEYEVTKNSIKFRPYIVLAKSFKSKHTVTFSWAYRKKDAKIKNGNYTAKEGGTYKKSITVHYSLASTGSLEKDVKYYPSYTKKKTEKVKTDAKKKIKKNKKKITKNIIAKLPTNKGKWFYNYDPKLTVTVKVGGDAAQSVTINELGKPAAPESVSVVVKATKIDVTPNKIPSNSMKPIRQLTLRRKDDSVSESGNTWRDIYTQTFPDTYGSGGDIDGINLKGEKKPTKFTDLTIQDGHRYQYAVQTKNAKGTNQKANDNWYYTKPTSIGSVSHERIGTAKDKQNRITLNRDRTLLIKSIIKGFEIQVSKSFPIEDASREDFWQTVPDKEISNYKALTDQNINDVTIIHTACEKDTPYSYRIKPFNRKNGTNNSGKQLAADWSPGYAGTEKTYNEPYKPSIVSGVFNDSTGIVNISVTREKVRTTADKMYIQRKIDNGEWEYIGSSDGIDIQPNIFVNKVESDRYTYQDNILGIEGQSIKYRVALGCTKTPSSGTVISVGNGMSEWTESAAIEILRPPNPPTPVTPINNSFVTDEDTNIRFGWIHSPKDGTQQTQAQILYRVKGTSTWSTIPIVGAAAFYDLPVTNFNVNDTIEWKVKTKGKHANFSNESKVFTVKVIGWPKITWTSPSGGDTISNLPLNLAWVYEDPSGSCKELILSIERDEEEEFSMILPADSRSYNFADYLFDDDESYRLILHGYSTTGLSRSSTVEVEIKYVPIEFSQGYIATGTFDEDTGYVYCSITKQDDSNAVVIDGATAEESKEFDDIVDTDTTEPKPIVVTSPVKKALLYRRYRGEKVLLHTYENLDDVQNEIDDIQSLDRYAPVNREFEYVILQQATTGEVGISTTPLTFRTLWWYVYYGDDEIARAKYDPTGSMSLSRPEKQQVRYSGRRYPVTYDSNAMNETYSLNFTIVDDEYDDDEGWDRINEFRDMMEDGGYGVWKSFEGDVYLADFDFSYSSDYTDELKKWSCSLSVTRIDDDSKGFEFASGNINL